MRKKFEVISLARNDKVSVNQVWWHTFTDKGTGYLAIQSTIPVAEEDTFCRGDIVTSVAGLSASTTYRFSSQTQLITDVTLIHPFSALHIFKPDSLGHAESLKTALTV